ncbi:hypothetical protein [Bradyrhizobium sp. CCBAU 51753]|uniref:hypothetical protein n=1 Tax=Bradyrhizobium sp. CCBAU 51753 TaxID=1325100 RepID=UPI00188ABCE6|nr:hypothetical protein [Bradyrhizobium sp. CCBAU 51753]QOZ23682.1 hypothetical protein XH93_08520 [Bradyrhizobium sp. CCBAU 51753]
MERLMGGKRGLAFDGRLHLVDGLLKPMASQRSDVAVVADLYRQLAGLRKINHQQYHAMRGYRLQLDEQRVFTNRVLIGWSLRGSRTDVLRRVGQLTVS